jgi:hypothetical protein
MIEQSSAYTFSSAAAEVHRIADWLGGDGRWWDLHDELRRCAETLESAAEGRYRGNSLDPETGRKREHPYPVSDPEPTGHNTSQPGS